MEIQRRIVVTIGAQALVFGLAMSSLGACLKPPIVIVDGSEPAPPVEGDRVAEAIVAVPAQISFSYDIGASGFSSQAPVDLAVLRELCRPHKLMVTEANIPFMGAMTGEMYTPRSITVTCLDGTQGRR
jgi:hypothetical protein